MQNKSVRLDCPYILFLLFCCFLTFRFLVPKAPCLVSDKADAPETEVAFFSVHIFYNIASGCA